MLGYKIYLIPIISGLIGWFTNFIAVKMIFRPYKPINLFILKIQGLMPKRQEELAIKIGETISLHLLSHKDIAESINSISVDNAFIDLLDKKLEEFINKELFAFNPLVLSFITDEIKFKIKNAINNEIFKLLPELGEKFANGLEKHLDIKQIIIDRVKSFDLHKLEKIILNISSRELKAIEIYGGILGFLIGLMQVIIILI